MVHMKFHALFSLKNNNNKKNSEFCLLQFFSELDRITLASRYFSLSSELMVKVPIRKAADGHSKICCFLDIFQRKKSLLFHENNLQG